MFWKRRLTKFYKTDQAIRANYMKLVNSYDGNWELAKDTWISMGADPNDMFKDFSSKRQKKSEKLIRRHYKKILKNENLTNNAWLLVQHSDDVNFQKWFLDKLDANCNHYRYLYDRICVNTDQPQKYNTQNHV